MNKFTNYKRNILPITGIVLLSLISLFLIFNSSEQAIEDSATPDQRAFIDEIANEAKALQKETHLFASITTAQAILESDWGRSQLAIEANNLFGIKGAYEDQSLIFPTEEVIDGELIVIEDAFKKYETVQQSLVDHMDFLKGGTYEDIKKSKDFKEAALALQDGGYATDPDYAEKLIALIEEFQLNEFD